MILVTESGTIKQIDGMLYLYLIVIVFTIRIVISCAFVIVNTAHIWLLLVFGPWIARSIHQVIASNGLIIVLVLLY